MSDEGYAELAGGAVLRSAPGLPAFPVRFAAALFDRAAGLLPPGPLTVWDPCCGSGYLATVLGLLRRRRIEGILASDVDVRALELAAANLALLTERGLAERAEALARRAAEFDKPTYAESAAATRRLAELLRAGGGDLPARSAWVDAFEPATVSAFLDGAGPDLVVTDVPYGEQVSWSGAAPDDAGPDALLTALAPRLPEHAVVVLVARARKIRLPEGLTALGRERLGRRAAVLVRAGAVPR